MPADVSKLKWTCGSVEAGVQILITFFFCFVLMPKILNVFSIYEEEEIAQYRTLNGARL